MSKDVIIAGAIAVGCVALIAVAFIVPKSKPGADMEVVKTETTVTDPTLVALPGATLEPLSSTASAFPAPGTAPAFPPLPGPGGNPGLSSTSGIAAPAPGTGLNNGLSATLPGPAPVPLEPAKPATETKTYTVASSGELLGDVALKFYGSSSAKNVKRIIDANPGIDAKRLRIGQKLVIPADKPADVAAAPAPTTAPGEKTYTVKSGDTLYKIAKHELNAANRWKEIEALNKVSNSDLKVGQVLRLPGSASSGSSAPAAGGDTASGHTHTVAKGESFADISRQYFKTPKYAKDIAKANPKLNPHNLKVGDKVTIPEIAGATSASAPATTPAAPAADSAAAPASSGDSVEYTVKAGDTFGVIAARELGSKKKFHEIAELNPGLDSHNLRAGQKIRIPAKGGKAADAKKGTATTAAPAPAAGAKPAAPAGAIAPTAGATPFPDSGNVASPYGNNGFAQPAQPFANTPPALPGANGQPGSEPFPSAAGNPFAATAGALR